MQIAEAPRYLTRGELAEHLHCSLRTADNLIASGRIRSVKIGGLRRVSEEALRAFLRELDDGTPQGAA